MCRAVRGVLPFLLVPSFSPIPIQLHAAPRPAVAGQTARPAARGAPAGRGPRGGRGLAEASFDAETAPARGGRGPRTGGRGGRGRRDGEPGGRREYERRDGTGRGHETEKRGGRGRGNWGERVEQPATEAVEGAEPAEQPELTEEEKAAAEAARLEAEAEERQLSLAAYEKQLQEKKERLNVVRESAFAGDKEQFKGMKSFGRRRPDNTLSLTKTVPKPATKAQKAAESKPQKEILKDVGFRVVSAEEAQRSSRGGRGGRFEGRPRSGGRGAPRSAPQQSSAPAINAEDTNAFPSL